MNYQNQLFFKNYYDNMYNNIFEKVRAQQLAAMQQGQTEEEQSLNWMIIH